jgi:hypothetical protein
MKWKSHLEIANAVAERLDLPKEMSEVLRQGSIQPDREGDKVITRDGRMLLRRRRVRHHRATKRFIRGLLWKARTAYLEGREEDAMWCLGRALHYVQDRSVAVGPFHWFHDAREAEIGLRRVPPDAVRIGEEAAVPSPLFIDLCLRSLSPKKDSSPAMSQASMISTALAFAVLLDPYPNRELAVQIKMSESRHRMVFIPSAIGAAAFLASVGIWLGQPVLVASSLPTAVVILSLDSKRRMLRREKEWFAPRKAPSGSI